MSYIKIFGIIGILLCLHFRPRENVVGASLGEAVVAHGENLMVVGNDTGSYLGGRVLGTMGGKSTNSHKILIPRNGVLSLIVFAHTKVPPFSLIITLFL